MSQTVMVLECSECSFEVQLCDEDPVIKTCPQCKAWRGMVAVSSEDSCDIESIETDTAVRASAEAKIMSAEGRKTNE